MVTFGDAVVFHVFFFCLYQQNSRQGLANTYNLASEHAHKAMVIVYNHLLHQFCVYMA